MTVQKMCLQWIPESVANIMSHHGIHHRSELAERLEELGISKSATYRSFGDDWRGKANSTVLAAVASTFGVALHQLVHEPAATRKRR